MLNAVVKPDKLRELSLSTIRQNLSTLRNRINALGVSEPLIQQQGDSRIVVELAGVQDPTEAKKLIGTVATLEYRAGYRHTGNTQAHRRRAYRQHSAGRAICTTCARASSRCC